MNLQQLFFVAETARAGSINKAARNLYVSQPNLSKAIQSLEEELQVALFVRNKKGVTLTEDGKEFLQYANAVLSQCNTIKQRFGGKRAEQPVIRISTNRLTFVTETLADLYNDELRDLDGFSLSIREIPPQMVYNDVVEGVADMAVVSLSKDRHAFWKHFFSSQHIETTLLFRSDKCLLLRKDHPLRSLVRPTLEDLKAYPLIQALEEGNSEAGFSHEIGHLKYRDFPKIIYAGDRSVVSSFLNATDAIYFTTTTKRMRRFYPDIVSMPLPEGIPPMTWEFFLLTLKNRALSREERMLYERLVALGKEGETERDVLR